MKCSSILLMLVNFLKCLLLHVILNCFTILKIPTSLWTLSSYSSLDPIIHPFTIVVVFFRSNYVLCPIFVNISSGCDCMLSPAIVDMSSTSDSIMCLTFVNVWCAHDYVLFPITNVYVSFKIINWLWFLLFVISWFLDLNLERGHTLSLLSMMLRRVIFWILMIKKLKMLIKAVEELIIMSNFVWKMRLMNGEFSVVLIQQDQLLIFQKMIF